MKLIIATTVATTLALTPLLAADNEPAKRLDDAAAVFSEIMAAPDKGIPQELLENAHCIVIVPDLKTAAFVVGGKYGKGYLSCRNKSGAGWSAPGTVRIEGGSVGFQIGGSSTDLIMLVMSERGADKLLASKFTLGAEGSVAAGPVGRTATAQTDAQMHADILSWSRSQGLFAGVALEGATLRQDLDDNATLYGKKLENRDIVTKGVRAPKAAAKLIALLNRYSAERTHGLGEMAALGACSLLHTSTARPRVMLRAWNLENRPTAQRRRRRRSTRRRFSIRRELRRPSRSMGEARPSSRRATPASTSCTFRSGGVKLSVLSKTGKEAVVAMLGPGDFFGEGCLAGQPLRMGSATAITPSAILLIGKEQDGAAAAQAACDVRPVHLTHAGAQHPDRRGPDRSALQLEREAAGAHAVAAGALREAGQAGPRGADDLTGNARGDDRHDALACEFLSEQIQEAGLHRLQRRAPAQDQQLPAERRPARLTLGQRVDRHRRSTTPLDGYLSASC